MGRHSTYTPETAATICAEIAAGHSLSSVCSRDEMPCLSAVYKWLRQQPDFAQDYARARETQADVLADEIVQIADSEPDPNRARVRVDARKWVASKLKPRTWGDRMDLSLSGTVELRTLSEDQLAARLADVEAKLAALDAK